ncbi:M42 family metallopeptidase [Alkaliphilus peptidifermentans]|uniref:Endoglucanase n=1 Tax=Alkaliphilus peptidifermentans DSM 18978 TaxID=1120976 RepID=A0A1G5KLT4_9FIRM|nr:M42 family metallopeptidase [Alkaliphilus peptidifermentans]SCZ01304.1 endoglucanase [Alkaliphilus peptidifermentans DSM 18978]
MTSKDFIKLLSEASGVSGYEGDTTAIIKDHFSGLCDDTTIDPLGNLICLKKGSNSNGRKIMLAAHMDEIGLMVKDIDEKGFVWFTNIGGIDQRTLLCQEVLIHGQKPIYGIIGVKPPHLTTDEERSKAIKMEDLIIDTGYSKKELMEYVSIGDIVTMKRKVSFLRNDWIAGKALDDRAGVAAMYTCLKELNKLNHEVDVYLVATVQEEVGTRGATTAAYNIMPDIGIAIDVGFGRTPDLKEYDTIEMDKGPALTMGPNIHPNVFNGLKEVAKNNYIDYQVEIATGHSGTDAWPMQVSRTGVATAVLSIPLRYMHTSVETISLNDVEKCGKLLAYFILSLNDKDLEEFLCY